MDYRVFDLETRAPLDTLELHVLARAYYAAWRVVHGTPPEGRHPLPMFNVFFEFDASSAKPLHGGDSAAQAISAGSTTGTRPVVGKA
jgi:hypothetical protein